MGHHKTKEGDFLSDKYRILRIDSLEGLKKKVPMVEGKWLPLDDKYEAYNHALKDIKKLSEEVSLNKIVLSFKDKEARRALREFVMHTTDGKLADDILEVLNN